MKRRGCMRGEALRSARRRLAGRAALAYTRGTHAHRTDPSPRANVTLNASETLASAGGVPVRATFLPLALPWIGDAEKRLVMETLESGWITTGPRAHELARRVAEMAGAQHGLAVHSATGALHLALAALGVGPGDEVITTAYTFAACVNVIEHVGAKPVLADIEPDTLCLDPAAVARALTPRTRAILPVDYAGHPCAIEPLMELALGA